MADRQIDEAKAKAWLKEVDEEIEAVKRVLTDEVPKVTSDIPGTNDTFTNMLKETNSFLETAWDNTTKGFKDAWDKVDDVLKEINRSGRKVAEDFGAFDKKAKQ